VGSKTEFFSSLLELTKHNQVRAAHLLGVTRNILRHRMKQFGLL
jgi:DNA-binding protein Fis